MEEKSKPIRFLLKQLQNKIDEDSIEFKAYLTANGGEREIVKLSNNYLDSKKYLHISENQFNKHYIFIDKIFYEQVSEILAGCNNLDKIDLICLILKNAYYSQIKSELNAEVFSNAESVKKEFVDILNIICKEVQEITIVTQRDGNLKIKNQITIDFLRIVLFEKINDYLDCIEYDVEEDLLNELIIGKIDFHKSMDFYVGESIERLLKIISLPEENLNSTIDSPKYSNTQLSIVFKLLEVIHFVNEDGRLPSEQAKFLRSKIDREKKKFSKRQEHFKLDGLEDLIKKVSSQNNC